jgi:hypothetical protein
LPYTEEEEAKTKVIIDWLGTYGKNASDSFIRATMEDNDITPADMAKATGVPLSTIQARYDAALPSTLAIDPTLTGKDTAAQIALEAAKAKAASDAAAAKIASDAAAAAAAQVPVAPAVTSPVVTTPAVVAPTGSSTPIPSKTIITTPTVSTPIVTAGLLDTPPAVAPVVPAAPPAVAPVVNVDVNNNGVIDAEEPPKPPVVPATPPVIPVTPTPPPPTSGGGLFSSPTRTTDLLFGDPYKYQRDKFTLLDNLLSYGRY